MKKILNLVVTKCVAFFPIAHAIKDPLITQRKMDWRYHSVKMIFLIPPFIKIDIKSQVLIIKTLNSKESICCFDKEERRCGLINLR